MAETKQFAILRPGDSVERYSSAVAFSWYAATVGLCALYLVLTACTATAFMADTVDYADSIGAKLDGRDLAFWEFGHLIWRPLGWLVTWAIGPWVSQFAGIDRYATILKILIAMNWLAGLAAVLGMTCLMRGLGVSVRSAFVTGCAFLVSFGVLQYVHSGAPYMPALACLVACLALLANNDGRSWGWRSALAAVCLAGAVGFWAPFVLAAPAALGFTPLWFGFSRGRLLGVVAMTAVFGMLLGLAYLFAIAQLEIDSPQALKAWITDSSHGIVRIGGLKRMVFGFPRSFLTMGDDGIFIKRYLLKDPYNPVGLGELVRLSLAKVAFFYLVLLATVIQLSRTARGRRMLAILLLGGGPVIAFGIIWQGGDVERYLPFYPLIFLAWALVLEDGERRRWLKIPVLALFVVMAVSNSIELRSTARESRREEITRRTEALLPLLKDDDRIFVVDPRDLLSQRPGDPLFPLFQSLKISYVIYLGHAETHLWREKFESDFRKTSAEGGRVWISKRMLSPRPQSEWLWVEGEDPMVKWADVYAFFQKFKIAGDVGGVDGFVLLTEPE